LKSVNILSNTTNESKNSFPILQSSIENTKTELQEYEGREKSLIDKIKEHNADIRLPNPEDIPKHLDQVVDKTKESFSLLQIVSSSIGFLKDFGNCDIVAC
jgi:hypothetical protein